MNKRLKQAIVALLVVATIGMYTASNVVSDKHESHRLENAGDTLFISTVVVVFVL